MGEDKLVDSNGSPLGTPPEDDNYHIDIKTPKKEWRLIDDGKGAFILYLPLKYMSHIGVRGVFDYAKEVAVMWYMQLEMAKRKAVEDFNKLQSKADSNKFVQNVMKGGH